MFFPSVKSEGQKELEWQAAQPAEASYSDIIAESFGSGREMSLSGAVSDFADIQSKANEDSPIVPKDQANQAVKQYGINFATDVKQAELDWHIERQENKLRREKINNSVKDNFFKRAAGFITEMGTAALDPAEIALGGLIGTGFRLAKAGKSLASFSKASTTAALAQKGGFAATFAEALSGNVASEIIIAGTSNAKKEEYSISQAIMNATIGTALVTGALHGVNKTISTLLKGGDSTLNDIQTAATKLAETGKSPRVLIEVTEQAIEKADIVDDALSEMLVKYLPDEADSLLKMSASDAIKIAKKNPNFVNELAQSDIRQKAWLKDSPDAKDFLTRTEMDEISAKIDSDESNLGYDPAEIEFKNSVPEELEETFNLQKYNETTNKYLEEFKDNPTLTKEIQDIDLETKAELETVNARLEYANCLKGLMNG